MFDLFAGLGDFEKMASEMLERTINAESAVCRLEARLEYAIKLLQIQAIGEESKNANV